MSFNSDFKYEPLNNSTSVRILLIAPGEPDDDIYCWLIPSDLDADHSLCPNSPKPFASFAEVKVEIPGTPEEKSFRINFDAYNDPSSQTHVRHPYQRYSALSYVWGDPSGLKKITVDGQPFSVTRNLYESLKNLRIPGIGMRFWIDAICINQADLEEKAVQIRMMKRIYQQADYVRAQVMMTNEHVKNITLLGETMYKANLKYHAENESRVPNPTIEGSELNTKDPEGSQPSESASQDLHPKPQTKAYPTLEDYGLPPHNSPLWVSWRHLFASPYFTRMWILQEYALAKKLIFACGSALANVGFLQFCVDGMLRSSSVTGLHIFGGEDPLLEKQAFAGFLGSRRMAEERARIHGRYGEYGVAPEGFSPRRAPLIELLSEVHLLAAGDSRDKVFALLGLASDEDEFLSLVSYTKPAKRIYEDFAGRLVELGYLDDVLRQAVSEINDEYKPSWVPDWGREAMLDLHQIKPKDFAAGGTEVGEVKVSPTDSTLHVRGRILDTVTAASLSCTKDDMAQRRETLGQEDGNDIRVMTSDGEKLLLATNDLRQQEGKGDQEVALEFMAEGFTFLLARGSQHRGSPVNAFMHTITQAPKDRGPHFAAQVMAFNMVGMAFGYLTDGEPTSMLPASVRENLFGRPGMQLPPTHEFMRNVIGGCIGRRFFSTSRGIVGMGSPNLEIGDKLVVVHGCKLPLILRLKSRLEEPKVEPTFQLVGDCYVDGLMYGQGLHIDGVDEEGITLV